uniref:Uncharacterized protein n=1 Tax=Bactrocera dorsalis TaxID=27457 RepID=A0A034WHB0_BACDO
MRPNFEPTTLAAVSPNPIVRTPAKIESNRELSFVYSFSPQGHKLIQRGMEQPISRQNGVKASKPASFSSENDANALRKDIAKGGMLQTRISSKTVKIAKATPVAIYRKLH